MFPDPRSGVRTKELRDHLVQPPCLAKETDLPKVTSRGKAGLGTQVSESESQASALCSTAHLGYLL